MHFLCWDFSFMFLLVFLFPNDFPFKLLIFFVLNLTVSNYWKRLVLNELLWREKNVRDWVVVFIDDGRDSWSNIRDALFGHFYFELCRWLEILISTNLSIEYILTLNRSFRVAVRTTHPFVLWKWNNFWDFVHSSFSYVILFNHSWWVSFYLFPSASIF